MPLPWLSNMWACNPFGAEPERDAAIDGRQAGGARGPSLADVLTPAEPAKDPEDYSTADWAERLLADWPIVANVIPPDKQVLKRDHDKVLAFANKHRSENNKRAYPQCFDYAAYQLHVMGFLASGPFATDHDTIMLVHEYAQSGGRRSETQVYPTLKAVEYLKTALLAETPVLIGLRLNDWDERPNERSSTAFIEPTNHFVVVVGMGTDDKQRSYFSFFDYYHRHNESDRLYLNPSLLLESSDKALTMTEVRISSAQP